MDELSTTRTYLESYEKYKLMTENTVECIWLYDYTNKCFKYISPAIFNLRGLTVDEAMTEKLEDCLTPDSIESLKSNVYIRLSRFFSGDRSADTISSIDDYQQYCKDGTIKTIEISTKFMLNEETNAIEILGVSRDVTERKKTELKLINELKDKDTALKNILNHVPNILGNEKCRVYCFGKFLIYGYNSTTPIKWRTSKSEEMFAYLLLYGDLDVPKWKICEALWPECSSEKIDIYLHTTIYKMKKDLTAAKIRFNIKFSNGCYHMTLQDVYFDITEFDTILKANIKITDDTLENYEKAFYLYKSDYLEGNDYIWSLPRREVYTKKCCNLATALVKYYKKKNDLDSIERILQRVLKKAPLEESAHEALLKLYFINKNRTAFVTHYHAMSDLFKKELGIEPSVSIQSLYRLMLSS